MILADEQETRRVEISGWDTDENFFVERAAIQNAPQGRQRVVLRVQLRVGSLVFLRLSEDFSLDRSVPIAYQVVKLAANTIRRQHEVELIQLHPREKHAGEKARNATQEHSVPASLPN
ncbi:MAG TPA: hypothetical protein VKS20_10930 [Candidatus Acidoferrales bacterium]|nr:hypothetical protein [Candidatus Acidoferrales bacterium]